MCIRDRVKRSQGYFKAQQKTLGAINGQVEETFSGHAIVKAFGQEDATAAQFDQTNAKLYESAWKSQFISGFMMPIMTFVGNRGYVAVAIAGSFLAVQGVITVGDIQAFIQYVKDVYKRQAYPVSTYRVVLSGTPERLEVTQSITVVRKKKEKVLDPREFLKGEIEQNKNILVFSLEAKPTGSLRPDVLLANLLANDPDVYALSITCLLYTSRCV